VSRVPGGMKVVCILEHTVQTEDPWVSATEFLWWMPIRSRCAFGNAIQTCEGVTYPLYDTGKL